MKRTRESIQRKRTNGHAKAIARATAASLLQVHLDDATEKGPSLEVLATTCKLHVGIDVKDPDLSAAVWTEWERLINELTPQE